MLEPLLLARVSPHRAERRSASRQLAAVTLTLAAGWASAQEDDHGDTAGSSTVLDVGRPVAGVLHGPEDVDVFRLDLIGRTAIEVRATGPTDTDGELLDSSGARLGADDDAGPGDNFRIAAELSPGVYYVAVDGSAGNYAVHARVREALDHGDTRESSTLLRLYSMAELAGVSPAVLLATPGRIYPTTDDVDVFRIDVTEDGTVVAVRTSPAAFDTYAWLLDSAGDELAFHDGDAGVRFERHLDAGIYYVRLGGHETGAYRILATKSLDQTADAGLRPRLISPGAIGFEGDVWAANVSYDYISLRFAEDFDDDGDDDLVLAGGEPEGGQPGSGAILLNDGDFSFRVAAGDRPTGVHPRKVLLADFNGDGKNDIFIADHGHDAPPFPGWYNQLLLRTPDGYQDATDRLPEDGTGFSHGAAAGDVDGDGDTDVLVANAFGGPTNGPYFLLNDGTANFVIDTFRLPEALATNAFKPWAVELVDLDSDGRDDLVAGTTADMGGASTVYWGSARGTYRDASTTRLPEAAFFVAHGAAEVISIGVSDCNGDGRPDLLLGGYDAETLSRRGAQLLVNRGGRTFADMTEAALGDTAWSPTEAWHEGHRFFDFNLDGTVDIVPQHYGFGSPTPAMLRPNVLAWLNKGKCRFTALRTTEFDNSRALWQFTWGTHVRVGASFKTMYFYGDGAQLTANAGVVTSTATIADALAGSLARGY
ncbi:MAG: VCBS repeat-containing protein [Gammaproteobacteria bacterium]|nr:VCBS repeat-containing protein [Gammaproteobacteria bacterium]